MNDDSENTTLAIDMLKLVANDTVMNLITNYKLDFDKWDINRPTAANSIVSRFLDVFKAAIVRDTDNIATYKQLFFAELFLYYAQNSKGEVALNILTDENLTKCLIVPKYIKEGLEWLSQ